MNYFVLIVSLFSVLQCKPSGTSQQISVNPEETSSETHVAHQTEKKSEKNSDPKILIPVPDLPQIKELPKKVETPLVPKPCVSYSSVAKTKLVQLAEKVQSLASGATDDEKEAMITEVIFELKGEELFLFKNLLEQNKYDLVKILFEDIDDEEFRNKIILHLGNYSYPTSDYRIISDIDDTVVPWKNDPRFPNGAKSHIPGIVALYQELDCNGSSHTTMGDLTFLSARPGILAQRALDKLEGLGFNHFGVIESQIENLISVDMLFNWEVNPEKIATNKLKNLRRFFLVYPDYTKIILFGDSGQGDVSFFRQAIAEFPEKIALAIVHDVKPRANSLELKRQLEEKGMYFVRNYAQGAKIAQNWGLISEDQYLKIKETTYQETEAYPEMESDVKKILLQSIYDVK